MLTCRQTFLLGMEANYRQLSWRERLGVRLHLTFCDACGRFKRQMEFIREAGRRFSREQDTDARVRLSAEALERIARHLDRYE